MEQHLKINKNFKAIIVCSRIFTITPISILSGSWFIIFADNDNEDSNIFIDFFDRIT